MAWVYNGSEITIGKSFLNTSGDRVGSGWGKWSTEKKNEVGITWQDDPDLQFQNSDGSDRDLATLKSEGIAVARGTAFRLLGDYDWYIIRNQEHNTAIPSAVTTYRSSVRSSCTKIENAITACTTVNEYKALHTGDPATVDDWPDKPSL